MKPVILLISIIAFAVGLKELKPVNHKPNQIAQTKEIRGSGIIDKIIKAESNWNPRAVSPKGAKGLMQLMDGTGRAMAKEMGFSRYKPFDEEQNIEIGSYYFSKLEKQYGGNVVLALVAYNWGPGNLDKLIKRKKTTDYWTIKKHIPSETRKYVMRILGV